MVGNTSGTVTVRLGALREPLAIYCAASGASTSEAIRDLLGKSLLDLSASDNTIYIDDESVPRVRLELRLTPRERAAIEDRCLTDGFTSANRWIVSLYGQISKKNRSSVNQGLMHCTNPTGCWHLWRETSISLRAMCDS